METGTACQCQSVTPLLHELVQSAQIIQAYAWGCSERLKTDALRNDQLSEVFQLIYTHVQSMGSKIHAFAEL